MLRSLRGVQRLASLGLRGVGAADFPAGAAGASGARRMAAEAGGEKAGEAPGEGAPKGERSDAGAKAGPSSGEAESFAARAQRALRTLQHEVKAVLMPQDQYELESHRVERGDRPPEDPDAPTALAVSQRRAQQPRWQKMMDDLRDQVEGNETVRKVMDQVRDTKGRIQERWETSDSEVVRTIDDYAHAEIFSESEIAAAMRVVRARDQGFDLPMFLRGVRQQIAPFERAYAEGDFDALGRMCSDELVERLRARHAAERAHDRFPDARVLQTYEVELVAMELVDDDPAMVVDVRAQRVHCVKDKFGNVVEGSPDQICTMFYFWELRQERAGYVNTEGKWVPPRWEITDHLRRPEVLFLTV